MTAADREGPIQWIAEIKRDGQGPPTLGEWELWDAALDGRIAAGLLEGDQRVMRVPAAAGARSIRSVRVQKR